MPRGEQFLGALRGWIGTPFHWEAALKGVGVDCRGTIAGPARELGWPEAAAIEAELIGYSRRIDAARLRAGLELLFDVVTDAWQLGDVLLLAVGPLLQPVHLAVYAGEGCMIHCYSRGPQRVIEVPMGAIWRAAVVAAFRWREPANG